MMRKQMIWPMLVFAILLAVFTAALIGVNSATPVLRSGDELPSDVYERQYAVEPQRMSDGGQRVQLLCRESVQGLTLTVADTDAIRVMQGKCVIYESTMESRYLRVQHVPLDCGMDTIQQQIDVTVYPMADTGSVTEVLSGASLTPIKLLIGSTDEALQMESLVFGATMLMIGMYAVAFIICMTLYFGKRTETYLLMISMVSLICMLTAVFKVNNPLVNMSFRRYAVIRPLIALFPVMINAGVCFFLWEDCLPQRMRKWLSVRMVIIATVALMVARQVTSFSFYVPVRFLMAFPIVYVLSCACAARMWGARIMLLGHALAEAVVLMMFVVLNLKRGLPGSLMAYMEMSQLSYLAVTICALLVVSHRFSAKFRESESLGSELKAINRELDKRVEERTKELMDEQMRRRNLMLNVIHDIRSPIFILRAYLAQLRIQREDESLMRVMNRKLDGLERLVEDLFMSSKLEDEGILFEEDRVCFVSLVRELAEENEAEAKRRGVVLAYEQMTEQAPVWIDPYRMKQAVQNLIDNAFTYTPPGGSIALRIWLREKQICLSVSDTGKGISRDDLPYVFDRYFSASRSDNPKSSGLGLSIARQIVQHARGTLTAQSEQGKGTTFTVSLPCLEQKN